MRNIKLTLEYEGSRFFGFQRQRDKPTIQGELEKALSQFFNREVKIAAAAGRTDTGVHAKAQVVHFRIDSTLSLPKIQKGLNALLPKEIAVSKIEEAPARFHARYGAKGKTYEYRVLNSPVRSPLLNGRVYQYPYRLNLGKIRRLAKSLVGSHNFKTFQASGSNVKTSLRHIRSFHVEKKGKEIHFRVEADGFLYHMVRNIVGTLLEAGRGRIGERDFLALLQDRKRSRAGPTAPAHGLTLLSVRY